MGGGRRPEGRRYRGRKTTGGRSRFYHRPLVGLLNAPPCAVDRTARALLTPEQAAHQLFSNLVEMFREAEIQVVLESRRRYAPGSQKKNSFLVTRET